MVHKFNNYLNEGSENVNLTYSAITALAVFRPEFFDFLKILKNRYFLTDNSFWQSFILEIRKSTEIKVDKNHIIDIKGISIENDWMKLKKCVAAAEQIRRKFLNIDSIKLTNDNGLLIHNAGTKSLIRSKKEEDRILQSDVEAVLGFSGKDIYQNENWDQFIAKWVELLSTYLNETYKGYLNFFIDKYDQEKLPIDWNNYKNFTIKGLGIKIEELPKLYYNSFYDFSQDICALENCFTDYKTFYTEWVKYKNDIVNKKIIYPLISQNKERITRWKDLIIKFFSLEENGYYRFDSKLNLLEIPAKSEFEKQDITVTENFWLNDVKDLIIDVKSDKMGIKISIGMKNIAPSFINIRTKYDERKHYQQNGEMGKL